MGFKKSWDVPDIARQINILAYEANSPYNTGFIGWGCKQDLYRIKWMVEDALKRCGTYELEEEFLKRHEQEEIIKLLKDQK
jgi:hypothetical protein